MEFIMADTIPDLCKLTHLCEPSLPITTYYLLLSKYKVCKIQYKVLEKLKDIELPRIFFWSLISSCRFSLQ